MELYAGSKQVLDKEKEIMKSSKGLNAFLLSNPIYRGTAEKIILVGTGICGLLFSWKTFFVFPLSHMLGGVLIILAYGFHLWAHKVHRQAHEEVRKTEVVVTTGIFSKIRHPLCLSIIATNIGIAFAFGVMLTFILALLTIVHWALTALKEEEALMEKFPGEYPKYKQRVQWRMIPWIF